MRSARIVKQAGGYWTPGWSWGRTSCCPHSGQKRYLNKLAINSWWNNPHRAMPMNRRLRRW